MGGIERPVCADGSGAGTDTENEGEIPAEIDALGAGKVLCDRHRKECFLVRGVEQRGTRLEQDGEEFYVPHSLLVPWLDSRLFAVEESASTDLPEWLSAE